MPARCKQQVVVVNSGSAHVQDHRWRCFEEAASNHRLHEVESGLVHKDANFVTARDTLAGGGGGALSQGIERSSEKRRVALMLTKLVWCTKKAAHAFFVCVTKAGRKARA